MHNYEGYKLLSFQIFANKLADTFGRKRMLMGGILLRGLFSFLKAVSPNIGAYIVFEAFANICQAVSI